MGFRHTDGTNARITGTPRAHEISRDTPGRFMLKLDDPVELQSPYLTLDKARSLIAPYKVEKPKSVKNEVVVIEEKARPQEQLSIFGVLEDEKTR